MQSRLKDPIHKIQKSNYTYTVALPVDYVRELGWQENQKVVIKKIGSKIIIEDWPTKKK